MNILFVHQNFPGQFRRLAPRLAALGHRVVALGQGDGESVAGVERRGYSLARGNTQGIHPLAQEFESKVMRGEACALAAQQLKERGFTPDIVLAHPGWGEALYIKEVFPAARLVCLTEFFYRSAGQDVDFDPEFPAASFHDKARLHTKNANLLLAMDAMDIGVAATQWQRSTLPAWARERTRVIHEGIDTVEVAPDSAAEIRIPERGVHVRTGDEVLTFVARNLEPVRGYHQFMRALPAIMAARPDVQVFIVGGQGLSYGAPPPQGTWRDHYLAEVAAGLDPARVHFLGQVPRHVFLRLMQVTRCHVYLTWPFVLSWSMLEAMSAGAVVVGSNTPPVTEVIEHGVNGILTDFFDPAALAGAAVEVLTHPERYTSLRQRARQTVIERFDLHAVCLPAYQQLLDDLG